jgi:hypothetical protein
VSAAYVDSPGDAVGIAQLRGVKARDLAERLSRGSIPYAALIECRIAPTFDVIVMDVETEIPQVREYDIRQTERLGACFDVDDSAMPDVFAMREDFPATPHLYPPVDSIPKHLCLFEDDYADLKRRWRASFFVRRIQDWLRLTARGELHAQDQPLEQALANSGHRIILPRILSRVDEEGGGVRVVPLQITGVDEHGGKLLVWTEIATGSTSAGNTVGYFALSFSATPHGPGAITDAPRTISDLHAFLGTEGDDFVGQLRRQLLEWTQDPSALARQLILIVRIPKRRAVGGPVEDLETWAFLTPPLRELGPALGLWEPRGSGIALMVPVRDDRRGESAALDTLNVSFRLSRDVAAQLNGRSGADDRRIAAVGAGALGSQVILNSARAAFGRWTIIDHDRLLPHNAARHALGEIGVGHHKAIVLASVANRLMDDEPAFEAIVADVLAPGPQRQDIDDRFSNADLIVDLAASIPVARYLAAEAPGAARRVSFFLNPVGTDLVMLAEDRARHIRLDMLEMQYYRAILRDAALRDHLRRPEGRIRYGRSCRDVSLRLPQELVALHAALATGQLRRTADDDAAAIHIWRTGSTSLSVSDVAVAPVAGNQTLLGEWMVLYDDELLETIHRLRAQRLPNETGGILLGAFDVERKIIYVVDTIPSPVDSQERSTLYIRGCEGLQEKVDKAREDTFEQVEYVGEWHSHPDGVECLPSGDDLNVLSWLTTQMDTDGVPGVMMIACDREQLAVLLAEVARV